MRAWVGFGVGALLMATALAVVACGPASATPTAINTLAPGEIALPTEKPVVMPSGAIEACAGIGISAVLRGDPHDPHVAWLITNLGGRGDVIWPAGYRARFVPTLEVLDAAGDVVLREGDPVTGGCVTDVTNVLLLEPPFK